MNLPKLAAPPAAEEEIEDSPPAPASVEKKIKKAKKRETCVAYKKNCQELW